MSKKDKKTDKQIKSFILMSLALSAPALANETTINENLISGFSASMPKYSNMYRVMYGIPETPENRIAPVKPKEPPRAISLYAVPQRPIEKIQPDNPKEEIKENREEFSQPVLKYAPPEYFRKNKK